MAVHPGEGVFMFQVVDPSVSDETDSIAANPELDVCQPDNGWRPWPQPCSYDPAWVERYRAAQIERVARIDAVAKESVDALREVLADLQTVDKSEDPMAWRELRRRATFAKYLTAYRTLADPA